MNMNPELQKIDWFEVNQPHICVWCNSAGLFFNTLDDLESVVCLHHSTRKTQKKDRPSNREFRTYLKVMDSMETCDNWKPVPNHSERLEILRKMGLIQDA